MILFKFNLFHLGLAGPQLKKAPEEHQKFVPCLFKEPLASLQNARSSRNKKKSTFGTVSKQMIFYVPFAQALVVER
jgi:hypothetical protein